jgi:hypothetical protein
MAKIIQIEATCCSRCDTMINAIEPVGDTPKLGAAPMNITLCVCCGHLMMIEHDLTLREPTTDELRKLAKHPGVVAEMRSSID